MAEPAPAHGRLIKAPENFVSPQGFRTVFATDSAHPYAANWWPSAHNIGYEHLFVHEVYEFITQLDAKKVTYPTFEDGVKVQKVLDTIEKSAKTRKWEKV